MPPQSTHFRSRLTVATVGIIMFVIPPVAASGANATPSITAHASSTLACLNAKQHVKGAQKSLARTKRSLQEASDKAAKRRLGKQLAKKKKALKGAKKKQAAACADSSGSPGTTPGATPAPNNPPAFPNPMQTSFETKFRYDEVGHLEGATTTITVISPATDPDGDAVTYSWTATNGSIVGNGLSATWERSIQFGFPASGAATITANDGKGGTDQFEFKFS